MGDDGVQIWAWMTIHCSFAIHLKNKENLAIRTFPSNIKNPTNQSPSYSSKIPGPAGLGNNLPCCANCFNMNHALLFLMGHNPKMVALGHFLIHSARSALPCLFNLTQ